MQQYRQRRREGRRCVTIELWENEIEGLIERGYLAEEMRNKSDAVADAVHALLDSIFCHSGNV
jgi:hypothetical protein